MLCIRKRAFANRAPIPGNYYRSCGAILGAVFLSVAVQLALSLDATPPGTYRQRGISSLQRLFRAHFAELVARYEAEFSKRLGKFRLGRITKAVERFKDQVFGEQSISSIKLKRSILSRSGPEYSTILAIPLH